MNNSYNLKYIDVYIIIGLLYYYDIHIYRYKCTIGTYLLISTQYFKKNKTIHF